MTFDNSNFGGGQFGNALSFDGFGQYANRSSGLPIYNNTNYSVALWVKGNGTTNGFGAQSGLAARVFAEASTAGTGPLFSIATDNSGTNTVATLFVRTDGASSTPLNTRRSTRTVFDGNWHHIVWVDSNGQGKFYVDGVQDETDFTYTRGTLTLNTTAIGAILRSTPTAPVNFFTGAIDEVALWNRALTISEIQEIRAIGVPAPVGAIPPSIVVQPVNKTNNIFQGDTNITFSVQANGTSPLSYHWTKEGSPISEIANPSATNTTLTLATVQPSDSGFYSVVITNVAGSITSSIVQLTVIPYVPVTNGEVLKLDFDDVLSANPASGFSSMHLGINGTNFNGVGITISALGSTTLDDRDRRITGNPNVVTNNPPA
ncbi:MAG TPA: LamG-like jellyroll fold domain-containing protein, partial [Pirellula sp.]|nr:LamG-like jellyroll fold domain-containing protein [Pirellula sp.]